MEDNNFVFIKQNLRDEYLNAIKTTLLETEIINNRYKIIKPLGKGGMGAVFLAEDIVADHKLIAVKLIDKKILTNDTLKTFKQEFEVMTRLKHPNLTHVFDFGHDLHSNVYYITMEYIDGSSLHDILKHSRPLPLEKTVSILVDLCRVLSFIHSRKITHRDINPNNIMITKDNTVKLMDFGLADLGNGDKKKKGTLYYMAPEIFQGNTGTSVDIFALGVTFFEMITNQGFYHDYTSQQFISLLRNPDQFHDYKKNNIEKLSNKTLKPVIEKMTAYDINSRYQTCAEIISDINHTLGTDYPFETEETKQAYVLGAGFVGREQELNQLKEMLKKPKKTHTALWMQAEAGSGKSRLFYEFKNWCQLSGIAFFEGTCYENIHKLFGPFLTIVGELLLKAETEYIQQYGPELKKILPYHDSLKPIAVNPSYDPQTERFVMVRTIVESIVDCSRDYEKGCVLFLNDMHWSDEGSIEVVDALLKKVMPQSDESENSLAAFRLYLSSRNENSKGLENIESKSQLDIMKLTPLSKEFVQDYIDAVFGENMVSDKLTNAASAIHEKVGGNPFFLQELIKSMITNKDIVRKEQYWDLNQPIHEILIPNTLKDLISLRLNHLRLSPIDLKVLHIMSLLNRNVEWKELNSIISVPVTALTKLEQIEILRSEFQKGCYEFKITHTLIQESIIQTIKHKEQLHELIAHQLELFHEKDLDSFYEELAYHYYHAQNHVKAVAYIDLAIKKTKALFENEKTITLLSMELNLLGDTDNEKQVDLLMEKGIIYWIVGKERLAVDEYKKAAVLAEKIHNLFKAALAYYWMGFILNELKDPLGLEMSRKSLELSKLSGNKEAESKAYNALGLYYFAFEGDFKKAIEHHEKGILVAKESDDQLSLYVNMGNLSIIFHAQGNFEKAIECELNTLKLIGDDHESQRDKAFGFGSIGSKYADKGDYDTALEYFEKSIAMCDKVGCIGVKADTLLRKTEVFFKLKRFQEARNVCDLTKTLLNRMPPDLILKFNILSAKISFALNKKTGKQELINLLKTTEKNHEIAELNYELWCMGTEEIYRNRALELYEELTHKVPDYISKERLKNLKENKPPDYGYFDESNKRKQRIQHLHRNVSRKYWV